MYLIEIYSIELFSISRKIKGEKKQVFLLKDFNKLQLFLKKINVKLY